MPNRLYTAFIVLLCIGLLVIAVRPVFSPYIVGTADGFAHKYRLINFDASLSEGILRPRWVGNAVLGYGAPLFIFNYSVPYYLVDALYRAGFSVQTASSVYAAITLVLSAFAMFALANLLWGTTAGIIAATLYTYAPYHLHTLYSYEAWGEMLAFVYPPLLAFLLLSMLRIPESHARKIKLFYALTIITWALFILTHNISTYITSPCIGLLALVAAKRNRKMILRLCTIALTTLCITCFFTLPAFVLTNTIKIPALLTKEMMLRQEYMIPLIDQMRLSWISLAGQPVTYKAFTVGLPIMIVVCTAILFTVSYIAPRRHHKKPDRLAMVVFGVLLVALILVDPVSSPLYVFRPLQYVLYPYRLLFLATFAGSVLAGYIFQKSVLPGLCILLLAVSFGYPFIHPSLDLFPFPPSFFSKPQMLGYAVPTLKTMGIAEFLPKTADIRFLVSEEQTYLSYGLLPKKFIIPEGDGTILTQSVRQESFSASIRAVRPFTLTISTLYYPNWRATIDTTPVLLRYDPQGRMTMQVPAGTHIIRAVFGYSTVEIIGRIISLFGVVLFIVSLIV